MNVFITGTGLMTCLGNNVKTVFQRVLKNESGIQFMEPWSHLKGQNCLLGGPVLSYDVSFLDRTVRRSMSRMSELASLASLSAVNQAKLEIHSLTPGRAILCLGSTTGSPETLEAFHKKYFSKGGPEGQLSVSFLKSMNHSVASNVALALSFSGALLAPCSACTTSSQAMILGWELLQTGLYDVVIAGGADELHPNSAAVFDIVFAASTHFNDQPQKSPRPFDVHRDGLVVSEGAGVVIMETEAHMRRRNAEPLAQMKGGSYLVDGQHMTQPQQTMMEQTMRSALFRANVDAKDINYVNAHATGTKLGDTTEARATYSVFNSKTPVSSLKGHLGHSLAACGAIEAILAIEMMKNNVLICTRNLDQIDPDCIQLRHLQHHENEQVKIVMSNNFAFGGISTSLILSNV